MWQWLKNNHPVVYEVIQWAVLVIAIVALIHDLF